MEGKTEEEVERYAKVFKERYKELNGMLHYSQCCYGKIFVKYFSVEISFACFIYQLFE